MIAFREALEFQTKVGRDAIEKRSRALANQLIAGLSKLPDVKVWTSPNPSLNAAVVSFLPGSLNSQKLGQALYEKDKIGTAGRGGQDRGGLRASPHFYNTPEEVDRLVSAVGRYLKTGV
jgi:selenocysteine lyase/cysteine desulfurase